MILGGLVSGNAANNSSGGGGVLLDSSGAVTIAGGTIRENQNCGVAIWDRSGTLSMGGNSDDPLQIKDNPQNSEGTIQCNVRLPANEAISMSGSLASGSYVGVTTATQPTTSNDVQIASGSTDEYTGSCMFSDRPSDHSAIIDNGTSCMDRNGRIVTEHHTNVADTLWLSVEAKGADSGIVSVGEGLYGSLKYAIERTSGDVTVEVLGSIVHAACPEVSRNIVIDGNGHSVSFIAGGGLKVIGGSLKTVSVTMQGDGTGLPAISVEGGGLELGRGTVISRFDHGAVVATGGTVEMLGGTVCNNNSVNGGAFHISGTAAFTMSSGTITGNTASGSGGALYAETDGTLKINGGTITNNSASDGGGIRLVNTGLNVDGSAGIKDSIWLPGGDDESRIHVTGTLGNTFTVGFINANQSETLWVDGLAGEDLKKRFLVVNAGYTFNPSGNGLVLIASESYHAVRIPNNKFPAESTSDYTQYTSIQAAIDAAASGETVYIIDHGADDPIIVNATIDVTGKSVSLSSVFRIVKNGTEVSFDITNSSENANSIIMRGSSLTAEMFLVESGAGLTLGTVILDGGAVWAGGTLDSEDLSDAKGQPGTVVTSNTGAEAHAPVIVNRGTLTMENGSDVRNNSNNYAKPGDGFGSQYYGGGVRNEAGGTFVMNGGSIHNCYAREGGAVMNVDKNGTDTDVPKVTIRGGTIENNASQMKGAAIQTVYGGATTEIAGGTVSGNHSMHALGSLTVEEGGHLTVAGGTVSSDNDPAIYVFNKYDMDDYDDALQKPYVEASAPPEMVIRDSPIITGSIHLDGPCTAVGSYGSVRYEPFLGLMGYTGPALNVIIDSGFPMGGIVAEAGDTSILTVSGPYVDTILELNDGFIHLVSETPSGNGLAVTVTKDGNPVDGATVQISGNDGIGRAAITGSDGIARFESLEGSYYNIIVTYREQTYTESLHISAGSNSISVSMPSGYVSIVVDGDVPVYQEGLEDEAGTATDEDVEVRMTVDDSPGQESVDRADGQMGDATGKEYYDVSITRTVGAETTSITVTEDFVTFRILYSEAPGPTDADRLLVVRDHDGTSSRMVKVVPGTIGYANYECYTTEEIDGILYVVIKAKNFSTYALGIQSTPVPEVDPVPEPEPEVDATAEIQDLRVVITVTSSEAGEFCVEDDQGRVVRGWTSGTSATFGNLDPGKTYVVKSRISGVTDVVGTFKAPPVPTLDVQHMDSDSVSLSTQEGVRYLVGDVWMDGTGGTLEWPGLDPSADVFASAVAESDGMRIEVGPILVKPAFNGMVTGLVKHGGIYLQVSDLDAGWACAIDGAPAAPGINGPYSPGTLDVVFSGPDGAEMLSLEVLVPDIPEDSDPGSTRIALQAQDDVVYLLEDQTGARNGDWTDVPEWDVDPSSGCFLTMITGSEGNEVMFMPFEIKQPDVTGPSAQGAAAIAIPLAAAAVMAMVAVAVYRRG